MNGAWNEFEQYCQTTQVQATDLLQLYMDNLKSGTYYRIEVRAHNAMGYSQPRPMLLKTARGELGSDSYDSVAEASFTSVASVVHASAAATIIFASLRIVLSVRSLHSKK